MATYRKPLVDKDGNYIIPVVDSMDDYSTEEVDTQRKWIDGKPIYKKTINFGQLPNNDTKTVAHNISNIEYVVKIEATAYTLTYDLWRPMPYSDGAHMDVYCGRTTVNVFTTFNASIYGECFVTLYYTKTS